MVIIFKSAENAAKTNANTIIQQKSHSHKIKSTEKGAKANAPRAHGQARTPCTKLFGRDAVEQYSRPYPCSCKGKYV